MTEARVPRNAMTVDVEDYFHAEALAPAAPRERWPELPSRVEASTDRVLELLAERRVEATFFVLGWVAERHPGLVRRIAEAGHEVACHGFSHRLVYRQQPEEFRSETARARGLLQDLSGQPVEGYRAASFSITRRSLWALDVLAELGFRYDSSIFPVHHDVYGMPGTPTTPYRVATAAGDGLVEFPLTTAPLAGLTLPCAGGGYYRLLPGALSLRLLERVNALGRGFVFYMHPWEMDPGQPRFPVPLRSRLRHYTKLDAFEGKLGRLLDRFPVGPMRALLEDTARGHLPDVEARSLAA